MNKIQIGIVDDHNIFRESLQFLLESTERFEVILSTNSFEQALIEYKKIYKSKKVIDILVSDFFINEESFSKFIDEVKKVNNDQSILALTSCDEEDILKQILNSNCKGIAIKTASIIEIIKALDMIYSGKDYYGESIKDLIEQLKVSKTNLGNNILSKYESLTEREVEVLSHISKGLISKEIADILNISKRTIDIHRENILAKFSTSNIIEVINSVNELEKIKRTK